MNFDKFKRADNYSTNELFFIVDFLNNELLGYQLFNNCVDSYTSIKYRVRHYVDVLLDMRDYYQCELDCRLSRDKKEN